MIAIGDVVANLLGWAGITKERVSAVTGKPCNCPKRQEALNRLGYRVQAQILRPVRWIQWRFAFLHRGPLAFRLRMASRHFSLGFRYLLLGK